MADRLLCARVHEDGRTNHPVTGERHGDVTPEAMRAACAEPGCGWTIRRNPAERPELEAICVEHIDDDEWMERESR